jgi:cyclopropane-fatty-acyl-phospholipid synthase
MNYIIFFALCPVYYILKRLMSPARTIIEKQIAKADVRFDGDRPWDIRVHNDRFYSRFLRQGSLGLGESYMDGWWDCDAIDVLIDRVTRAGLREWATRGLATSWYRLNMVLSNEGRKSRAFAIGQDHYDIGNDVFEVMLDKRLTYTCAYWSGDPPAKNLDEAQEAKLDLTCRKLGLQKGMTVLDIGCGWGSLAKFAAERYGVNVIGVTVSKEQIALGKKLCAGLPVDLRFQDYRDVTGTFDRVVSQGMFEHVGYKNYRTFFKTVRRVLHKDGLFLLHTIGDNTSTTSADPWLHKYIFPTGMEPSLAQIGKAVENLFIVEDLHNFGAEYDKTLLAWHANFMAGWATLKEKYGERFFRMWTYYLLIAAGTVRARESQLWQFVLSPKGVPGGYRSIR